MLFPISILHFLLIISFYSPNYGLERRLEPKPSSRLIDQKSLSTSGGLMPPEQEHPRAHSHDSYFDSIMGEEEPKNLSAEGLWNKPSLPVKFKTNTALKEENGHIIYDEKVGAKRNTASLNNKGQTIEGNLENNGGHYGQIIPYNIIKENRGNVEQMFHQDNSLIQRKIHANGRETMGTVSGQEMIPNLGENGNNEQQLVVYSGMPLERMSMEGNGGTEDQNLIDFEIRNRNGEARKMMPKLENIKVENGQNLRSNLHGNYYKNGEMQMTKWNGRIGKNNEEQKKLLNRSGGGLKLLGWKNVDGEEAEINANFENGNNFGQGQNNLLENSNNVFVHEEKDEWKSKKIICNLESQGFNHISKNSNKIFDAAKKCTHLTLEIGEFEVKKGEKQIEVKNFENRFQMAKEFKKDGAKLLASWSFGGLFYQEHKKGLDNQIQKGGQMFRKRTRKMDDRVNLIRNIIEIVKLDNSIFDGILLDFSEFKNFSNFYADLLRDFYLELILKKSEKSGRRIFAIRLDNNDSLIKLKNSEVENDLKNPIANTNLDKLEYSEFVKNLKYADLMILKTYKNQQGNEIFDLAKWLKENMEILKKKKSPEDAVYTFWKNKNYQKIVVGLPPMEYGGKSEVKSAGERNGGEGKRRTKKSRRQKRAQLTPLDEEENKTKQELQNQLPLEWHGGIEGHNKLKKMEEVILKIKNEYGGVEIPLLDRKKNGGGCPNEEQIELVYNEFNKTN